MSRKIFTLKIHMSYYKQTMDTFDGYMNDDPILSLQHCRAVDFLRECSPYETLYPMPGSRRVYLHRFKAKHSEHRRKIYVRPLDETKYSTQLEDSVYTWRNLLGKEVF